MKSPQIRIGTSSWSSSDWVGPFYPRGTRPADFLGIYATRFDTVECDATFYRVPSERTVDSWRSRTPEGFLLSSKLPREITHEAGLVDCAGPLNDYLAVMERLGSRRGPAVAQFAYFAKGRDPVEYKSGADFRQRLTRFLDLWPQEVELVVEVRNAHWIAAPLLDLLRERRVGLVLPAIYTLPGPARLFSGPAPVTSSLIYVRFLGNHKQMDRLVERLRKEGKRATAWGEPAMDRTEELRAWVAPLKQAAARGAQVLAYFNNHYAGYGPGTATLFRQLWEAG